MTDLRRLLDDGRPIFGTDGVRGVAGSELTPELALAIGRAAGSYLRGGPVVVGQDTRRSGSMLSAALQAGFHAVGIDTIDVGISPVGIAISPPIGGIPIPPPEPPPGVSGDLELIVVRPGCRPRDFCFADLCSNLWDLFM